MAWDVAATTPHSIYLSLRPYCIHGAESYDDLGAWASQVRYQMRQAGVKSI